MASHVGLSSPSVSERVRRLEERGVIRAFTLEIDRIADKAETNTSIIKSKPIERRPPPLRQE